MGGNVKTVQQTLQHPPGNFKAGIVRQNFEITWHPLGLPYAWDLQLSYVSQHAYQCPWETKPKTLTPGAKCILKFDNTAYTIKAHAVFFNKPATSASAKCNMIDNKFKVLHSTMANPQYGCYLITPESTSNKMGLPIDNGLIDTNNPLQNTNAVCCIKTVFNYM